MNRLIVLSGVPGSGKSHFSASLKRAINKHLYIVSSDALRYNILGDQRDLSEDDLIWKIYYSIVETYSIDKDGIVVLDATHSKKTYRLDNMKRYRSLYDEIDLICFKLDPQIVIAQNSGRNNPIPDDALMRLMNEFEMPDQDEYNFYDHVDIVTDLNSDQLINRYLK